MITAIVNQKGGVAKTTTTHALASALASMGKRVLMVDLDAQASLTICAGGRPYEIPQNMYHVICKKVPISDIIYQTALPNLFIAPSGIHLANAELDLVSQMSREGALKKALQPVVKNFDHILIDCSPSLSLLVVNALAVADQVIIPCSADYLAYQGLQLLTNSIHQVRNEINPDLYILGVIITMSDKRTLHNKEVKELIAKEYNILGEVGISVRVKDAVLQGLSIVNYDPSHQIALAYKEIANSL